MSYRLLILILLIIFVVMGCQSTRSFEERLDAGSGITLSSVSDPLVFARIESRYSRSARDYIYMGPVEVNRQGYRDYFLWVGVGSTIDRGYLAPAPTIPATLLVSVRDELMALELLPWDQRVPDVRDPVVYDPAVKVRAALGARVSRQQLRMIAEESMQSIQVIDCGGNVQVYSRWSPGSPWSELVVGSP